MECYFIKFAVWKPATLLKVTLLHGCFWSILFCTNGIKSRKTSQRKYFTLFHQFIKEKVFKNGQIKFQVFQKFYLVHLENYYETAER